MSAEIDPKGATVSVVRPEIPMRFSAQAENSLRRAGWYPGRQVPDLVASWKEALLGSDGLEMFPSAEIALLEFGGLKFDEQGPGVTCSREPFELDPTLAIYESDRFDDFVAVLDTKLFPLGEAEGGLCFVVIGENGRVYLLMQDVMLVGLNVEDGLESLLVGRLGETIRLQQNPDAPTEEAL